MKRKKNLSEKVAYFGIPGSYSYLAGNIYFSDNSIFIKNDSIHEVMEKVEKGESEYGVVPLENTTTGSIAETYDHLLESDLSIVGEVVLHIHHHLLVPKDIQSLKFVKRCYSHQQAIMQCRNFFIQNKNIRPVLTSDTASAAKLISEAKKIGNSAIASKRTAGLYNLKILDKNIEDNAHNYTRFVIVSKKAYENGNKISILFSVEHKPGSLFNSLSPYARLGLNLTKIESRPVFGKPWEYIFFIDFEIKNKEKELNTVIEEMKEHVNFLKILGRYKKGTVYET